MTCRNDKSSGLDGVFFNDFNRVDGSTMSDDEILFQEEVFGFLVVEIYFGNVPEFHLAGSVAGDEVVVVFGGGDGGESIVIWMLAIVFKSRSQISQLIQIPKTEILIRRHRNQFRVLPIFKNE